MTCNYPLCRAEITHIPVVEIPTIRTKGLIPPALSPLATNAAHMKRMELDMAMTIRLYEAQVAEYKASVNDLVSTDEPTILMGAGVCSEHAKTYKFLDWFGKEEWEHMCEGARNHSVLLDIKGVKVKFKPVGWMPGGSYVEVER